MTLDTDVAVAGYGDAYADEDTVKSPMHLAVEATIGAIDDASIDKHDIDAIFTGRRPQADTRKQWNNIFASYLNIPTNLSTEVTTHGGGVNVTVQYAMAAINAGLADTVLCVQSDAAPLFTDPVQDIPEMDADPEFEYPYGPLMPSIYALVARRYMHEYDVTHEQMARFAVESRKWATRHPKAAMGDKGEITVDDVITSRPIAEPLHLLDCAPWGPGGTGGALIVTTADRAETLQPDPIYVRGVGTYNSHEYITNRLSLDAPPNEERPNLTTTGAKYASRRAYDMAGLSPEDMDLFEPCTNFSHIGLLMLEDFGFCEKGSGGAFVADGGVDFDSGLPVNTNGGWISFGQPGVSSVMDVIVEGVRQLRKEALGKQVPDAETAMVHGMGGTTACHSATIFSSRRGVA